MYNTAAFSFPNVFTPSLTFYFLEFYTILMFFSKSKAIIYSKNHFLITYGNIYHTD